MRTGKFHIAVLAGIFLLGALIYSNTINNGFVMDDRLVVQENTFIRHLPNIKGIFDPDIYFQGSREGTYRPVTTLSYFLDNALWGNGPRGYHLTNIMVHLANAGLLYFLIFLLLRTSGRSFLHWWVPYACAAAAGLLFLVHPLQTETVNNIGTRHDELAAFFCFLAAVLYLLSDSGLRSGHIFYGVSLGAYMLSCFSKETGITLPAVLLLFDLFRGRNLNSKQLARYAGYVLCAAFFIYIRFFVMKYPGEGASDFLSLDRLLLSGRMVLTYIGLFFFPLSLSVEYQVGPMYPANTPSSFLHPMVILPVLGVFMILWGMTRYRRRYPLAVTGLAWYFVAILPVSNIFFKLMQFPVRERYAYMPVAGLCVFVAAVLLKGFSAGEDVLVSRKRALGVIFGIIVVLLSVRTYARNFDWKDGVTLWGSTLETSPESYRAYYNLAMGYQYERGDTQKAIEAFKNSLSLRDFAMTHDALGYVYYQEGMYKEALERFLTAKKMDPALGSVYYHLGLLYLAMEEYDKAIAVEDEGFRMGEIRGGDSFRYIFKPMPYADMHFVRGMAYFKKGDHLRAAGDLEMTVEMDPAYPEAMFYLGYSLIRSGKEEKALDVLKAAVRTDPENPRIKYALASVFLKKGAYDEAAEQYVGLLALDPDYVDARNNLANIYYARGMVDEAIAQYEKALELDPGHMKARNNLANIYLNRGEYDKALEEYRSIISSAPGTPVVRYNMGLAYFGKRMFGKAAEEWREALRMRPDFVPAKKGLQEILNLKDAARRDR